jgi:hypothetical protein
MMADEDEDESPHVNTDKTDEKAQDTCLALDDDLDSEVNDFTIEEDDRVFMTMVHPVDPHHFVHALSMVSGVMFHIVLTSETLLMNQRPLQYTAAAVVIINVTAAATVVITNVAAAFIVSTTVVSVTATVSSASAVSAVFTTTTAASVSSTSAADRSPHSVNSVRPWSYYPMAPFPQLGTNIWMKTDRVRNDGDQRR